MKTTTFNIYRYNNGNLSLKEHLFTFPSQDWARFLKETGQLERLAKLETMSSRKRSPLLYRLRRSPAFLEWQKNNIETVKTTLFGVASAFYDGRLPEDGVKLAILEAIRCERPWATYQLKCDQNKPEHLKRCYCFPFDFKCI